MTSDVLSALILAVIQGFTEWLPISSSGHLILFEKILGFNTSLPFDVALHFGTLMAVFVYFGKEIVDILEDLFRLKFDSTNGKMGIFLIFASIPAAILGYFTLGFFEAVFSNLTVIAWGFALTGMFLLISSVPRKLEENRLNFKKSFLIGVAQALAIIPGISRSGATISAGIMQGLNEKDAMKFSFLLSIPIVFGANLVTVEKAVLSPTFIWATLVSFLVGLLSIYLMFNYVLTKRKNLFWFGLYCLILAFGIGFYLTLF